jgi:hypothetical protein
MMEDKLAPVHAKADHILAILDETRAEIRATTAEARAGTSAIIIHQWIACGIIVVVFYAAVMFTAWRMYR